MNNSRKNQTGVGMIEVLVTLLIVSVGFLNMAALQTVAKRSNFDSVQRTTAVMLAHDIVERMRSNPVVLDAYLVSNIGGGSLSAPASTCLSGSECSPLQLAARDLYQWEQAIDGNTETRASGGTVTQTGGLASPTACLSGPAAGGPGIYTITIVWRGRSEMVNVSPVTCGMASGNYGANQEFRRIMSFNTYISS